MGDFLNHICGQNLLQIVATGNSIIAELLRLKVSILNIGDFICYTLKK